MQILQLIADPLRMGLMIGALVAFAAIVVWTLLRPRQQIEADAQLWKDDEKQVPSAGKDQSAALRDRVWT